MDPRGLTTMKVEYINPFLNATTNVLKTMAFTEAKPGKPYRKDDEAATGDITGIIGITGATEGSLSHHLQRSMHLRYRIQHVR